MAPWGRSTADHSPSGERGLAQEFDAALNRAAAAGAPSQSAQVTALVTVSRRIGEAGRALPAMDEAFRAQLRERLVRLTPELVSGPAPAAGRGGRHAGLRRHSAHAGTIDVAAWRWRLFAAGVGVAVATGSVGGIAIASSGALPGGSLYSAKRMFERLQLSLSGSPTDQGRQYLQLADTRLTEIDTLLSAEDTDLPGSPTAGYLDQSLTDLQSAIGTGGDELLGQVGANGDQTALHALSDFLLTERQRVADLAWQLPAQLQDRPARIVALMDGLYQRLQQLAARPAAGASPAVSATPGPQSTGAHTTAGSGAQPEPDGTARGTAPSSATATGTGPSPTPTPPTGPLPPLPLPTLGTDTPPLLPILPSLGLGLDLGDQTDPAAPTS